MEDAAVDRLQAVAGVGQRALGDGRERVAEVALLERLAQVDDRGVFGREVDGGVLALAMRTNHSGR